MGGVIQFQLGAEIRRVVIDDPTRTVLDWLREEAGRTGTKEGCNEGDCGACTVLIGRFEAGAMRYRAVNACIRFLPSLDGCHVLTVEDLAAANGALHPIQRALVDHHGAQCGFCTPGFAMRLADLAVQGRSLTRAELALELAGNLCRCTGYRPILDAGQAILADPPALPLAAAVGAVAAPITTEEGRGWLAPTSLAELATAYAADPEALLLAGGTDIGLWVTKQGQRPARLISLERVAELRGVTRLGGGLAIGAATPYQDLLPVLVDWHPDLARLVGRIGSPQIRATGTIGGNLVNGSPIGDMAPALLALGAELVLQRGDDQRRLPLAEFFLGYRRTALQPGEFITRIDLPALAPQDRFFAYKISKRFDQDISAVCLALWLRIEDGLVQAARLGLGGMAATPTRAPLTEAALIGRPCDLAAAQMAAGILAQELTPLSDWRASAAYRRQVAGNLLVKAAVERTTGQRLDVREALA